MLKLIPLLVIALALALLPVLQPKTARAVNNKDVTVTILTYQEIKCPDGELVPCPGDYMAQVKIGDNDFQSTPKGPTDTGLFSPYWRVTKTVDRDANRFVPIRIELYDDDLDGFNPDDQVDITGGGPDKTLDITLDLDDGTWGGENGINNPWTQGAGDDPDARVLFDVGIGDGDFDDDGIPDGVERFGIRKVEDGSVVANLANFGSVNPQKADPCRKTIAIEIDYMTGAADGHSHIPQDAALTELQNAYAAAPVPRSGNCPYSFFGFGQADGVQIMIERDQTLPEQAVFTLDDLVNRRNDANNFLPARRPYMHYIVFAHDQEAGSSSGGLCCRDGKDLIVTLGSWGRLCVGGGADGVSNSTPAGDDQSDGNGNITNGTNRRCETTANGTPPPPPPPPAVRAADDRQLLPVNDNTSDQAGTARDQSATVMHELGHAMGLEHHGADELNNTPNYLSVMNYIYPAGIPLAAGGFQLDYSSSVLPTINEASLSEQAGIGGPAQFNMRWFDQNGRGQTSSAAGPIDWNRSGGIQDPPGCAGAACVRVDVDTNLDSMCIGAGGDGTLDTTPTPDDAVANGLIVNGANDRCETAPANDDMRLRIGAGNAGADINDVCVDGGPDNKNDSTTSGDDTANVEEINSGPNQVCDSTASGNDVQVVPVGRSETRILSGFNDWAAIQFRGVLSASAAGAGNGHPGDITYEDKVIAETRDAALLDPDIEASKSVDKADAGTGEKLTYTVTAKNIGSGDADQVKVTDTFPDGTTEDRTPPKIYYGASRSETFTYTIPCGTADGTVLTNNASITAKNVQSGAEANTSNNSASVSTTVHAPVMTLTKSATSSVNAGEAISYTLTYANTGSGDAASVTIKDTLPADVYYSFALDLGSGPQPVSVALNANGTRTLTWNVGAVAKNSGPFSINYTARPTLLSLGGTTYTNSASLTFSDANGCEYPPVTDAKSTSITVVTPTRDPLSQGFWGQHPELWSAELRARIQATDQRYDGIDGSTPDGALSEAEVALTFAPAGNQPRTLQQQLLALYFNLADRRVNAGTLVKSKLTVKLGLANVRDVAIYGIDTLKLPVTNATKGRYSDATTVAEEVDRNRSPVY